MDRYNDVRFCPYCGAKLHYIEQLHEEFLPMVVGEQPYYECFECGGCFDTMYIDERNDYEDWRYERDY